MEEIGTCSSLHQQEQDQLLLSSGEEIFSKGVSDFAIISEIQKVSSHIETVNYVNIS